MKKVIALITRHSPQLMELGLFLLRVSIGLIFMRHGYPKLFGGLTQWSGLGSAMAALGITFFPTFWGLCASIAEAFGGTLLVLGLGTRVAALLCACVMKVALIMHISNGDNWNTYSHALSMLMVMLSLCITGGGRWSLDTLLNTQDS